MDLSISTYLPDWLASATAIGEVPDTVWAAMVSAVLTLALSSAFLGRRPEDGAEEHLDPAEDATACEFLINGASLRPLSAAARALLGGLGGHQAPLQALTRHLEENCPRIGEDLEALILFGAAFRRHCLRGDGTAYEIAGEPRGAAALLSIRPATPEARALEATERALARATDEVAFHRDAIDRAPVLVWTSSPNKQVLWANAAYRDRFDLADALPAAGRQLDAFAHLLEEVPLTARSAGEIRRRVKVSAARDGEPLWFELSEVPLASGDTLSYAVAVDDLVAAEASLRRFVETLTETFAHLPIGLAVFDKNRRLGLFNPALSDLVKIDAVWLAGRPSLRDFLERLRETRQMPEQKDFAGFRRMLTELEKGARDGTYEENWVLPSGKIFRVTGRPHPQGALAFLFEDISPAIHLERRYRAELELSQATLDRMSEAVAVFDTSGMLVFVNSAFEALWGLDPMERLDGPTVGELVLLWEKRCQSSGLWSDLRAFATGADSRTSWTGAATTLDGRALTVLVAPLPTGSTLVTFRESAAAADSTNAVSAGSIPEKDERASSMSSLALAEIEAPAEAALAALGAAIAASPDARAFSGLSQAAQDLKDGLARARALQGRAEGPALGTGQIGAASLSEQLAALLSVRGLKLGAVVEHGPSGAAQEQPPHGTSAEEAALSALALAAAAFCAPGGAIELTVDRSAGPVLLALHVPASVIAGTEFRPDATPLALARRRLANLGAELELSSDTTGLVLGARFSSHSAPALAAAG